MASEADFYIKQDDTSEPLRAQLLDSDGNPKDLTGDDVKFKMKPVGGDTFTVDASATIDSASDGEVSYSWSDGDTETAGYYNAVFRVDYDSTGTFDETFPNSQYIVVRVDEAL
jgi:hypothetical protein